MLSLTSYVSVWERLGPLQCHALFIADADMNSEDNRKELARACGKYLLGIVEIFLRVLCFNVPAGAK